MTYRAPVNDMLLALNHGAGLQAAVKAGHYGDFDADITAAVLEEAGKFASLPRSARGKIPPPGELRESGFRGKTAACSRPRDARHRHDLSRAR